MTVVNIGHESFVTTYNDGSTLIRKARKIHHCAGGHDGKTRVPCLTPIWTGQTYIEYLGESPCYQSGKRYHLHCAVQQGLLRRCKADDRRQAEREGLTI